MKHIIVLALLLAMTVGCTENSRAKNYGGTATMDLPQGKKLVTVTWKDDELWVVTRQRREGEAIESYEFQEESSWGVFEGTYIINEK